MNNNKTYRAINYPIESYSNRAVVDCNFTFELSDGSAYDFSDAIGLFLSIYDRRDGLLLKQWTESNGLVLSGNTITWNERNQSEMNFSLGKYYYEIGYTIVDYDSEDEVNLAFGEMKFV